MNKNMYIGKLLVKNSLLIEYITKKTVENTALNMTIAE